MRPSTLLQFGLGALAYEAPLEARARLPGTFQVSNFVFGCTVTCDWSFNVAITGNAANHPAVSNPVKCAGSTKKQDYKNCGRVSDTQTISAYIDEKNQLRLQYEVDEPEEGARYNYFGHRHVNAATSGKPQAKRFKVRESSATAVA